MMRRGHAPGSALARPLRVGTLCAFFAVRSNNAGHRHPSLMISVGNGGPRRLISKFPFAMKTLAVFLMFAAPQLFAASPGSAAPGGAPEDDFRDVPVSDRPWAYWWWLNGHVDRETITSDMEAMRRVGFGGLLIFDARGYWDDEGHLVLPKPEMEFMGAEWREQIGRASCRERV